MAGQLTIDTLRASTGVLATQNGMTGIAKSWVQFAYNGSAIVVYGSFNVSSVTYITAGTYQVNFTTAMPNTNYVANATVTSDANVSTCYLNGGKSTAITTGYVQVASAYWTGTSPFWAASNPTAVCVSVFSS